MRKIVSFFIFLTASYFSFAQDFSNKGKDFWLGYGYHVRYVTNGNNTATGCNGINCQDMVLYFATENIPGRFTNIKIEIPALGYVETIPNVAPGTIATSSPIPKSGSQDARLNAEGLFTSGIHVTSDRPVVAYTHIYNGSVSGATLLFPTNTLGKEYYALNYKQVSNENFSNSFFFVVAADTGTTTVEITPSGQTQTHAANVPFNVTLNQGEIYNVMGELNGGSAGNYTGVDLSGSKIRSISIGGSACKRIAVFSGTGKIKIACAGNANSSDNLIAQAFPKTAWGKKFLTAPTQNMPNNYFRIGVSDPATVVKVDGVPQTGLINSFYYDLPITDQPQIIEADQPIMVAQFITTANTCGNTAIGANGDPEMIYLSPIEQTIDEVILNSTPNDNITQHWINVILKTVAVPSFNVTGAIGSYNFIQHPLDPNYSYAQISVSAGTHTLSADSGFNAIAYGYGNAETYGYNAGTNLKDLYNFIEPLNPLNISGTNSACACTPFYYTITYPFQPLFLDWDFKGFQPNVSTNNPVADSTYFINGKQVWRYKLPTPYSYCPSGNYPLSITAGTAGTDGCGNTQVKDDTIFVRNLPTPDFNWTSNGCLSDSVRLSDNSFYEDGVYSYRWTWDFGDGSPVSTEHNPVHKYAVAGTYTIKFSLVTNIGCISPVASKQIAIAEVPVARFGISNPLCQDKAITFSDSSSVVAPGTIKYWYMDYGDGTKDTLLNNSNHLHTYTTSGSQTAALIIETPGGCTSLPYNKTFVIHPNPVVDFNMPAGVCLPYGLAQFTDISSIADGTQAGFTWLWKFGEPSSGARDSAIIKNPTHLYDSTGPFNVNLKVTSVNGCTKDSTKLFSNVYPKATGSFTVNAENCFNTATSFSSTSNGQGNTITNWFWNFGDGSAPGTGQNVIHTYITSGTFTIKHWVSTDKGCNSDTVTNTVTVNPLPVPNFSFGTPACEKNNISIIDMSTPGAGNITAWTWNFANGRPDSIINNSLPFAYKYDTAKTYTVKLSLLTDKGCVSAAPVSKSVTINPLPKPGFISPEVCLSDASALFVDTSSIASGTLTNWAWNFGDPGSGVNNLSVLANPSHRYNAIGAYTAKLTLTSNSGCVDSLLQSFTVNGDIPKANFITAVPSLCAYDSVAIKDSSTVNFGNVTKVEIYWDLLNSPGVFERDDLPAFGKTYKHKYANFQAPLTKDIFIKYKSYSGTSCVDSVTKKVTLNAVPKVQFNAMAPVCLDAVSYQITAASEIGGVPGTPVFTGPGVNSNGLFTPSLTGAGTFRILYTYTSAFGCTDTISQSITVLVPAVANFGNSVPACQKNAITFTDSSSIPSASGTITNWSWNFGDGSAPLNTATNAPVNHTFTNNSTYIVTLTVTSSNGCKVSRQKQVLVNPLPVPGFKFPASICLPDATVIFTDTSGISDGTQNAFTYSWNFDDPSSGANNTSTSKNPTHRFSTDRTYNVHLTIRSGAGCIDSTTIALNTIHPQPVADFTSDSVSICETQSVKFSDNSTGADGTVNKWLWDFGNGQISTDKLPVAQTYSTAKLYSIELQIENTFGCKDTAKKTFTVYAFPVISAGPNKVLLEGGEIALDATATGNGLQYLWTPARFLNNTRILKPVVKGLNEDDITYTLLVTATGGCQKTDDVLVTLLKAPVIPNTFTPNGDGVNENWTIQYLDSYPECKIKVFNREGQAVYEALGYRAPGWDGKYKGKVLPFGTYYYIIEPGSGRQPITGYVTLVY